jgi:hypothetical protein
MSHVTKYEPISSIGVTAGEPPSASTLDWLKEELAAGKTKDVIASLNGFGNTVTIGKSQSRRKLSTEATKREVGQLLELLRYFADGGAARPGFERAHTIMGHFAPERLPAALKDDGRPRYDLGVLVSEKGDVKGLVFNAVFRPIFGLPKTRGVEMTRNEKGGLNVDLGPDVVAAHFLHEHLTIPEIVQRKVDAGRMTAAHAHERIDALKAEGFDLHARRPVLEAALADGTSQLVFLRNKGENNPKPLNGDELKFAEKMGYKRDNVPRDFGIACVDTCVETGDLLGQRPLLARKPVINIYHPVPGTSIRCEVTLAAGAYFSSLYPKPIESAEGQSVAWEMRSGGPSGELFDPRTERRYPYLYWEAMQSNPWRIDRSRAHCVRGSEAAEFLEQACKSFAFNAKETADFITYWIAALEQNEYNVIQFMDQAEYARFARMEISPAPDQVTRVFMLFEGSNVPVDTGSPTLEQVVRHLGFVVLEWGGSNLDEARKMR